MTKIWGIDLGTNSIGWAIVEKKENGRYRHIKSGVDIFKDGVDHEGSKEKPCVQLRTGARGVRRRYFRRRLHKIELLKILVAEGMCPSLTDEELQLWRDRKVYPKDEAFMEWQRTNDNEGEGKNPYYDRHLALTKTLDLTIERERFILGRALYHLSQRRGFLSNRKESTKKEDGVVKGGISDLSKQMTDAGCEYLGEYFYRLYKSGKKIRGHYTSRKEHYLKEFLAICDMQNIEGELRKKMHDAIFFQRPLKSQKGSIGHCTLEPGKQRCSISHPDFEEYRMWCFINNIKIFREGEDADYRPLTEQEKSDVVLKFLRKTQFKFEQLAKVLARKKEKFGFKYDSDGCRLKFNYRAETSIAGSPVTAGLMEIFGDDWKMEIASVYAKAADKSVDQIVDDVWHTLYSFDNDDMLRQWAKTNLQLDDKQADKFVKIKIERDYASLSLNAIRKILPYLRQGLRYDEAVICANIPSVCKDIDSEEHEKIVADVIDCVHNFKSDQPKRGKTVESTVNDFLHENYGIEERALKKVYHPSKIETYPTSQPDERGLRLLGSPRTSAVRNPMAMRALFRLRALVNEMIKKGDIDSETVVNIEFARGLNDGNMRKAIQTYQDELAKNHEKYAKEIKACYLKETGVEIEPTDDDILKYQLWEEQGHQCLYTGKMIGLSDFIGTNPKFDIEHTVPRALGGDDSQMNKTLCDSHFNRDVKINKLPSELANHKEILMKARSLWQKKIDVLSKQIEGTKGYCADKEKKDDKIKRRHVLKMKRDYYIGKMKRFEMTEVPDGFSNRQGVDIGIIGKYAKMYLHTVFDKVFVVKGATTAAFRRMWGLQSEYEKKERVNHTHHCVDAITIACIGKKEYDDWKHYQEAEDMYRVGKFKRPSMEKPWDTFTEDVKQITGRLLIHHFTPDNAGKASKKKLRVRGRIQRNNDGEVKYATGDCARLSLHEVTFYGAIKQDDEIRYVVRKKISDIKTEKDADKIVDPEVRQKVKDAIAAKKDVVWMNEEKKIRINKVRIYKVVKNPLRLKKHRDLSRHDYKRDYFVVNDENYCMGLYEGIDGKGKTKRSFKIVNNMEAASYFKAKQRGEDADLMPLSDSNDYPLKYLLKKGTMVLFYQDSPKELKECTRDELAKRLYRITIIEICGRITLAYHQEARPSSVFKGKNGTWKIGEALRPRIIITHNQANFLVEGVDFRLTLTGDVEWLK